MAKLISRTYGEALFELAVEEHKEDLFLEETEGLLQILSENPELMKVLKHPKIAREEKVRTLKEIFGQYILSICFPKRFLSLSTSPIYEDTASSVPQQYRISSFHHLSVFQAQALQRP